MTPAETLITMIERRGARGVRDIGVRTRGSDRTDRIEPPPTPHGLPSWLSTFNLRWVDHMKRRPKDGETQAN